MPVTDTKVDDYILKSADFAQPILTHLRQVIHSACPNVKEVIKWGFPNFEYGSSVLCNMASFKQHCSFGFWRASLLSDPHKILSAVGEKSAMGHLGRLKSVADLPAGAILIEYIKEAMALIDAGTKVPRKEKSTSTTPIEVPHYFRTELLKNEAAQTTFENFSPSHKKEYLEWITEAKTEATRNKRIANAIEWLQEGKSRNWKYLTTVKKEK